MIPEAVNPPGQIRRAEVVLRALMRNMLQLISRTFRSQREVTVSASQSVEAPHELEFEGLTGRESVPPDPALLTVNIDGKAVMVTGAGGSIGAELCRQICALGPSRLVLCEVAEHSLYEIERELRNRCARDGFDARSFEIIPLLGSVEDQRRLATVMQSLQVQTVFHAAAYKHVPLVEMNPIAGVRNNVFGTLHLARAALESGVGTFVLVSTDKAVRPASVMGASKRLSEMILQDMARDQPATCFSMVRFGNVWGSSGSVVPLFREQIAHGGPVTVTHPDVVRYFMSLPEAAQLVLQAGAIARGGDVCLLDMGEPLRVLDLAHRMIRLSGLQVRDREHPDGDIAIHFCGLRPGEKLREELLVGNDDAPTGHPLIRRANEACLPRPVLERTISALQDACHALDNAGVRETLRQAVAGYRPQCGIQDPVWLTQHAGADSGTL